MRVVITQDKIEKSKIIPPGKYVCSVAEATEESAVKDGSTYYLYILKVAEGQYSGAEIRFLVSEKGEEKGYPFWEACGFKLMAGADLNPLSFKGKRVGVYNQRGEFNGSPQNQAVDFFAVESAVADAAVVA